MKVTIACLVILSVCSCKQCGPVTEPPVGRVERQEEVRRIIRNRIGTDIGAIRGPLSVAEAEKELDSTGRNLTIAPEWKRLKARFQPGDELYYYTTDLRSWGLLVGSEGYVLVRGGAVMGEFVTGMN